MELMKTVFSISAQIGNITTLRLCFEDRVQHENLFTFFAGLFGVCDTLLDILWSREAARIASIPIL